MPIFTDLEPTCSEEAFGEALAHVSAIFGYLRFHPRPCRVKRNDADTYETAYDGDKGYPDWTLVHARTGFTVIAELKSKGGKASPEQQRWLDALALGPTPVFLWRPSDWGEVLAVLEAGARTEPRVHMPDGSTPALVPKASDDPDYRHAQQTVEAWWNHHKADNDDKPPTAQPFVACVKVVAKLYKAGWSQLEVKCALIDTTVVSVGAMEFARNKRRARTGHAVNEMSVEEWRRRNAGKSLTDREPRPEASTPGPDIIDATSRET